MTNIITLDESARKALTEIAASAPGYEFDANGRLHDSYVDHARRRAAAEPGLAAFTCRCRSELETDRSKPGYVVIDDLVNPGGDEKLELMKATAVFSLIGRPFRMIERLGFWQELGVNFATEPFRFGGLGDNPLHIDGVNTTYPPDYVVLVCFRKDPAGGGTNLVASLQRLVDNLPAQDRDYLSQPIFREGKYFGITGVGPELNPFPVVAPLRDGLWRVRITGKVLPEMPPGPHREYLARALKILAEEQMEVRLEPGQALVVNQVMLAHGRHKLGSGQQAIPPERRRQFRQTYFAADADTTLGD